MSGTEGSASLSGAAFDLRVGLVDFRQDLATAKADATKASEEIRAILSGTTASQGTTAGSGYANLAYDLREVQGAAGDADLAIAGLTRRIEGGDSAALGAARGASLLADAYKDLANAAEGVGRATGASDAQIAANTQKITQGAQEVTQAVTAQAQAQTAASARVVDANKAELAVQTALNSLRTGQGRAVIDTGKEPLVAAVEDTENALEKVQAKNFGGAFDDITAATARTRTSLADVNAQIQQLASEGGAGLTKVSQLLQEFDRLQAVPAGTRSDADEQRFANLVDELANVDTEAQAEGESFNKLNTQAKTLTTSLGQLARAQEDLAGKQERVTQQSAEQSRAQRQAQADADRAASQQAALQRAATTQQAVAADPQALAAAQAATALEEAGLRAKEAQTAVNSLQAALNSLGRAQTVKDLPEGFQQTTVAATALTDAMKALGQGDVQAGIDAEAKAIEQAKLALVETNAAAEKLRATLQGIGTDSERQLLDQLTQRASALQQVVTSSERSSASLAAPGERAQIEAENEAKKESNRLEQEGKDAAKQHASEVQNVRTAFTGLQNVLGALNEGGAGRAVGGVGRGSTVLDSLGIDLSTAAALGLTAAVVGLVAAVGGAIKVGADFDSFIEQTSVRLRAAEGDADAAAASLDKLLAQSTSRTFGSFSTDDLAAGVETLKRLEQDSDEMETRIANVAAATGKSYSETAQQVTHFYDVVKTGQPFGDIALSLERAGILTSDYTQRLRAAAVDGATAEEKVQLLNEALDRFGKAATDESTTAQGGFQRFRNELGLTIGTITGPLFTDMSKGLQSVVDVLSDPKLAEGAKILGQLTTVAFDAPIGLIKAIGSIPSDIGQLRDVATGNANKPKNTVATDTTPRVDLAQDRYQTGQEAYDSGQSAVGQFAKGFDDASNKAFSDIDASVEAHLTAISGGKLTPKLQETFTGTIEPLLARAVDDIQKYGAISDETSRQITVALGTQAQGVLDLANAYAGLRDAVTKAADAEKAVASAQSRVQSDQDIAAQISAIDQQVIDDAKKKQDADDAGFDKLIKQQQQLKEGWQELGTIVHDGYQKIIDGLDAQIKAAQRANEEDAEIARAHIQELTDGLDSYQRTVDDRRRAAEDALDAMRAALAAIQTQVQQAQTALSQHQAAYQAVLSGSIDYFNAENTEQDEITKKIIAKWDAEISGLKRASDESEHRVTAETQREHALALAYDKRIQAARDAHREDQARALESERDRVIAASRQGGQVDRDQAQVDQDKLANATNDLNTEAKGQQSSDQVAVNQAQAKADAAQKELDAAQALETAKEKAEDAEVRRRQDEIAHEQRVEADRARNAAAAIKDKQDQEGEQQTLQKQADAYYASIQKNIDDTITRINTAKDAQHTADQQRIDDATTIKAADDKYWKDRATADNAALLNAQAIKKQADDTVTAFNTQITNLGAINKQLDARNTKELAYLNLLRQELGLQPLDPSSTIPGTQQSPVEGNVGSTPPPNPGLPGGGAGGKAGGGVPTLPLLHNIPGSQTPRGYHAELDDQLVAWYVQDGFHLEDYGKKQWSPNAPAPAPQTAPPVTPPAAPADDGGGGGGALSARAILPLSATAGAGAGLQLSAAAANAGSPIILAPVLARGGLGLAPDPRGAAQTSQAPPGGFSLHIDTVNASDPGDVERMIGKVEERIFGTALAGFDIGRRGGIWPGRLNGS